LTSWLCALSGIRNAAAARPRFAGVFLTDRRCQTAWIHKRGILNTCYGCGIGNARSTAVTVLRSPLLPRPRRGFFSSVAARAFPSPIPRSASHVTAGAFGILTLSQCAVRPDLHGEPTRSIQWSPSQPAGMAVGYRASRWPSRILAEGNTRALADFAFTISVFAEASLFLARDKPRHLLRLKRFLSFQSAARATQRPHPLKLGRARICPRAAELPAPSHRILPHPRIHSATLHSSELLPHAGF